MRASCKIAVLSGALWLATLLPGRAQVSNTEYITPDVKVMVRAELSGDVSISAWSRNSGREVASALPEALHCQGKVKRDGGQRVAFVCPKALRRNGLALEAAVDVAPIARSLDPATDVLVWVDLPRVGVQSSSTDPDEEDDGGEVSSRSIRFVAGKAPGPIRIRIGYEQDQLAGIYLPLVALALGLTAIVVLLARAGLAGLSRSIVLLGTIVWMGVAVQLQAGTLLRIALYGKPLANFTALLVEVWPPLFCIAIGVAMGSRIHAGETRGGKAIETMASLGVIPLLLTCVVGALPSITNGDWARAILWIAATPIILLLLRSWIRTTGRAKLMQLTAGELKERLSALAAKAGCPEVKIYISISKRSRTSNAFSLPGKSIFLTAGLIRLLSRREVDAVAAHELSHFRHSSRGVWMALCLAMLMCETPVSDQLRSLPGGLLIALLLPITIFFISLRGTRRREFAADAGAAAITGDPRAMISSLAKLARSNQSPLEMNPVAELLASHPSMKKRIRALAVVARLDAAEVDRLCSDVERADFYELPAEAESGKIFTLGWQKANAAVYGWVVILGSCVAGLLVAWLLDRLAASRGGYGIVLVVAGIALGCAITKALASAWMWSNFGRLRRKIEARLGVTGQLVGLAMESEPRLYGGFRFSDAGILRFDGGRLCYRSERVTIALNSADVVDVSMIAASPSNWARRQPMVRFRGLESGAVQSFILHPVDWLPTQRRLLNSIQRWKATESSPENTMVSGFSPVVGQAFVPVTIVGAGRGFLVPKAITLFAAISGWGLRGDWSYVGYALLITACSYIFLLLPSMLYRQPAIPAGLAAPADAN